MWSIAIIVGVAVASSVFTLAAGISLAVSVERHKHRKILKAHGIDLTRTPGRRNSNNVDLKRSSIRLSLGLTATQLGGWTVLDSGPILQSGEATELPADSSPVDEKDVIDSTHQPSRKGSHRKQRLKKSMPLYPSMNSPLSAITEFTGSPHSTSSPVELPTGMESRQVAAHSSWPLPVPWPLAIAKTRTNSEPSAVDTDLDSSASIENTEANPNRPKLTIRTVSTTSTLSIPPAESLPPLPIAELPRRNQVMDHRSSIGSVDTANSSVLEHTVAPPIKTPSQALHEFDFGLNTIAMRLDSPARQTQRGFYDQRAAVTSSRASVSAAVDLDSQSGSNNLGSSQLFDSSNGASRVVSNASTRHSMFAKCSNISVRSSLLPTEKEHEPSAAEFPSRPASVSGSCGSSFKQGDTISRTSSQGKGHRRQNCVRISIAPAEIKNYQRFKMPQVTEEPESDPVKSSRVDASSAGSNSFLWPQPLALQRQSRTSNASQAECDIFCYTGPSTPQKSNRFREDTSVSANATSPARGHHTPTLPSPAYSPARLFPRISKVQGPRIIPHRSQQHQRKPGTPDLRRSIMLMQTIDPDAKSSDRPQRNSYYNIDSARNSKTLNSTSPNRWSSSARTKSPLSSRSSTPQKEVTYSQSTMSIWEDIPIDDDSEPEMPTLTHSKFLSARRDVHTPLKMAVDNEAYENMIGDLSKGNETAKAGGMGAVGLGLQDFDVQETPRSLYDREGFLKE